MVKRAEKAGQSVFYIMGGKEHGIMRAEYAEDDGYLQSDCVDYECM